MANQNNQYRKSRIERHSKKRKENFVLNILIGIVFILIVIVGVNLLRDNDTVATGEENQSEQVNEEENITQTDDSEVESTSEVTDENDEDSEDGETEKVNEEEETEEAEVIYEESDDPNVEQVIINPNWEPIGTVQTGEHISSYDKGTTDREEMEKAMEYATGVSVDNMIVWWVGNGGKPNENVVGTISNKDKSQIYRVYMDWVDGQGWKPTKVEKLKSIDR